MRIQWARAMEVLAAQWGINTDEGRGMGTGPLTGCGRGERDIVGRRKQRDREIGQQTASNRPVGLANQSPWTGELSAYHGEPTMGSLVTGSPEIAQNPGMAVRCLQG